MLPSVGLSGWILRSFLDGPFFFKIFWVSWSIFSCSLTCFLLQLYLGCSRGVIHLYLASSSLAEWGQPELATQGWLFCASKSFMICVKFWFKVSTFFSQAATFASASSLGDRGHGGLRPSGYSVNRSTTFLVRCSCFDLSLLCPLILL